MFDECMTCKLPMPFKSSFFLSRGRCNKCHKRVLESRRKKEENKQRKEAQARNPSATGVHCK